MSSAGLVCELSHGLSMLHALCTSGTDVSPGVAARVVLSAISGCSECETATCLSRERGSTVPLVSVGPSGIGGEFQMEVR
jgi:hypothetical protein